MENEAEAETQIPLAKYHHRFYYFGYISKASEKNCTISITYGYEEESNSNGQDCGKKYWCCVRNDDNRAKYQSAVQHRLQKKVSE